MGDNSNNQEMSTIGALIWTVIILVIIAAIISLFLPKCANSGCDNSPTEGSSYCSLHKYSSYRNYTSNYSSNSYSNSNSTGSSGKAGTTSSTTNKSYSTKSFSSNKKTDDPYGAKDYNDPEDFYYDNYDDFWEYEEAEDYYNEVWDE